MYDLLLKGAHVVDPLNGVNGVNDVAVAPRQYVGVALRTAYARDERRDDVSRHGRSLGRYSREDAAVRCGVEYGHFAVCVAALHL